MDLKIDQPKIRTLFMYYNIVLTGVWIMRAPQAFAMPFMVVLHAGLAYLFLEWPRMGIGAPRPWRILSRFFPFLVWALAWSEIGWMYDLARPVVHDGTIRSLDLALVGFHLNENLALLAPWSFVREVMGLSYLSYYLLVLGPPVVLAFKGRSRELEDYTFGLISTYLVCFVIYLVVPVLGPRDLALAAGHTAQQVGGLFGPLIDAIFAAGDSLGTAFPSSHCAGSVAAALLVRRHFGRITGLLCFLWAGFIVVSTVYTNNHYAVDAAAGVLVAVMTSKLISLYGARSIRKTVPPAYSLSENGMGLSGRRDSERKGGLS